MKIRLLMILLLLSNLAFGQMNIYPQIRGCECLPAVPAIFDGTTVKADSVFVDTVTVFLKFCTGGGCGDNNVKVGITPVYIRAINTPAWAATDYYNQEAADSINSRVKQKLLQSAAGYNWGQSFGLTEDDVHTLFTTRTKDYPTWSGTNTIPLTGKDKYHSANLIMPYNWFLNKRVGIVAGPGICTHTIKGGGFSIVTITGGVRTRTTVSATVGALEFACNYIYKNPCQSAAGSWFVTYPYTFWGYFTKKSLSYVWRNYRNDILYPNVDYWTGFEPHLASFVSPLGNRCLQRFDFSMSNKTQAENSILAGIIYNSGIEGRNWTAPCWNNGSTTFDHAIRFNSVGLLLTDPIAIGLCTNKWHLFTD